MAQLFVTLLGADGAGAGKGVVGEGDKAEAISSGTCSVARASRGGDAVGDTALSAGLRIGLERLVLGLELSDTLQLTGDTVEGRGGCCNQRGTNSVAVTRGTNSEAVTRNAVATGMGFS